MSGVSSTPLNSLESFFASLTAEMTANIAAMDRTHQQQEMIQLITATEKKVEEAEDILEQMELEIRGSALTTEQKERQLHQWQSLKTELQRLVKQFHKSKSNRTHLRARAELFGAEIEEQSDEDEVLVIHDENDPRKRLAENVETLERSGRKLNRGRQLLEDTKNIGAAVLNDLVNQRDTIQGARGKLRDTEENLQSSSKVLGRMLGRILQSKLVLAGVMAAIVIMVIVIVFMWLS